MPRESLLLILVLLTASGCSGESTEMLMGRGCEYANAGRSAEAIEIFTRVLRKDPANKQALCARGAVLSEIGKYAEAFEDLRCAIPYPPALQNRARLNRKLKRYDAAIADAKRLLEVAPESDLAPRAYEILGSCYSARSEFEKAAANYQKVSELEPEDAMAFINFGGMLFELGKYEDAETVFTKAIRLAPKDYAGWALRANARQRGGDIEGADHDREMARELRARAQGEDEHNPKELHFDIGSG